MTTIQRAGHTRYGASAATAAAVTGITTVTLRDQSAVIRPEPTWDEPEPDPELGALENELELAFKHILAANTFNQKVLDSRIAGDTTAVFAFAMSSAAIGAGNPLYVVTIALRGVSLGGKAGQENIQTWTYPAGATTKLTVDPAS